MKTLEEKYKLMYSQKKTSLKTIQKLIKVRHKSKVVLLAFLLVFIIIVGLRASQTTSKAKNGQKSFLNQTKLGEKKLPRGWRNNNPGNLEYSVFNNWVGKVPYTSNTDGRFEQYVDFRSGVRALIKVLIKKIRDFGNLKGIIESFAPPSENNTPAYINAVSLETGFSPLQILSSDKNTLRLLTIAITRHENGKEWAISSEDFENGYMIV